MQFASWSRSSTGFPHCLRELDFSLERYADTDMIIEFIDYSHLSMASLSINNDDIAQHQEIPLS